ncbi:MAG: CinA family nicotinamide mononucleotide deamidase-related protein, partial [Verrucomicrobiota bacterium]
MRIEVVNTGTELLLGKVINTHLGFFGEELFKLGLRVQRQTTIPDGEVIRDVLTDSFSRSDVILITGGLGPTSDDVTRDVVADLLGRDLHEDLEVLATIQEMFRSRGLVQNRNNDRQALVPSGGVVLPNRNGTAPGLFLEADPAKGTPHLFLLPGPPRELKPMFLDEVIPRLASWIADADSTLEWHNFRIYGVGESNLAATIEPKLADFEGLEIGYCARLGEVDLRLIGSQVEVSRAIPIVREAFREDIVTESEDPIEAVIRDLLIERGETVSTAESCTGGCIAHTLTNVSGSSDIFPGGYVTYANSSKTATLGVDSDIIEQHGAVSEPVVRAMAEGCLETSGADHAIAVSGIAGPTGGSDEKPVGTVWLAIASRKKST